MGKIEQPTDLSLSYLLKFIIKNMRILVIVGLIAAVASAVVSLIMTEYFTSHVVLFPARTSSIIVSENAVNRGNIGDFGEEEEAEQLLQIINAEDLKERVIARHDLYTHYDINPEDKYAHTLMITTYNDFVSARRTKYNSVEISVTDKDPVMAAAIANSVAEFTDTVKNRMISERAGASFNALDKVYQEKKTKVDQMSQYLDSLHVLGVGGEGTRASLYRAYGQAIENNDRSTKAQLKTQIDLNKLHGDAFDIARRQRDFLSDELQKLGSFRDQFIADAHLSIAQTFMVDRAYPADKKSKPVRWLIVMGATIAAVLFTLLLLLARETLPDLFS